MEHNELIFSIGLLVLSIVSAVSAYKMFRFSKFMSFESDKISSLVRNDLGKESVAQLTVLSDDYFRSSAKYRRKGLAFAVLAVIITAAALLVMTL